MGVLWCGWGFFGVGEGILRGGCWFCVVGRGSVEWVGVVWGGGDGEKEGWCVEVSVG